MITAFQVLEYDSFYGGSESKGYFENLDDAQEVAADSQPGTTRVVRERQIYESLSDYEQHRFDR